MYLLFLSCEHPSSHRTMRFDLTTMTKGGVRQLICWNGVKARVFDFDYIYLEMEVI